LPVVYEGDAASAPQGRYAIVVSRYNEAVTRKLLAGATQTLKEHGVADDAIDVAWVPGAWEIPLVAARFARAGRYLAVICLGAVIRGETTHDRHINRSVSDQLGEIAVATGVPIGFGVLTCGSLEHALQRAGGTKGNKGAECARAILSMASLLAKAPPADGP
jgi:6,7-dimethyl-8-ribityllumazine synthase